LTFPYSYLRDSWTCPCDSAEAEAEAEADVEVEVEVEVEVGSASSAGRPPLAVPRNSRPGRAPAGSPSRKVTSPATIVAM